MIPKRRILIAIILFKAICLSFHLIGTCQFLSGHFFENELTTMNVKLDMQFWRENYADNLGKKKIPRHIHQIWINTKSKVTMQEKYAVAAKSCLEKAEGYNYTLWRNENIVEFLEKSYPWFLPLYRSYSYDMQRVDAMKYILLYHFGGLYLDIDLKCLSKNIIESMIPESDCEPEIIFHMGTEGISANTDLLAAQRYHPFFKLAVTRLKSANRWFYLYHFTIVLSAGPTFLFGIYRQFPIKDRFYFVPNHVLWGQLFEGVGGGTWYGSDTFFLILIGKYKFHILFFLILITLVIIKIRRRHRHFI